MKSCIFDEEGKSIRGVNFVHRKGDNLEIFEFIEAWKFSEIYVLLFSIYFSYNKNIIKQV